MSQHEPSMNKTGQKRRLVSVPLGSCAADAIYKITSTNDQVLATNSVQITATRAPLLALLLDREPPPAFAALPDGITTVLPLALPLTPYVFHGAFHGRPT